MATRKVPPKGPRPSRGTRQRDATGSAAEPPPPPAVSAPAAPGFQLRGAVEQFPSPSPLEDASIVTLKAALASAATRADLPRAAVDVAPDDVVEVEFGGGERLWMRGDEYRLRFGVAERGAEDGVLQVPSEVNLLPAGMATRGPVAWVVKGLKVFGVDLAGGAAEALAARVDHKRSQTEPQKRPGPGLYRCPLVSGQFALTPAKVPARAGDLPWLVFIHGTGSSTWGSFGELWSPERKDQLQALLARYEDRVLAFEHPTLSQSPAENARDLARALPKGARLHLVTHSRGGLVGELLSRGSVQADAVFDDEQLEVFAERPEAAGLLRELAEALRDNQLTVERFVRVACPALGTTLASGRLDRWLSVIGSLAGAALPGSPLAEVFADLADFVAAVVKERTDPERLPGLEAMMPDSPFIKLVNWPEVTVAGDLAVVAGDIEPDAWWARLLVWLSDRFYDGDHDLVVNTPSMYGGAQRAGRAMVSFHKAPAVNHFTYFKESSSAERLVSALTADDGTMLPVGFEPLRRPTVDIARAVAPRGAEARPVVFVLPGIMGSVLESAGSSIWLRLLALLRGGMARLAIEAPDVVASEVMARAYGELIERLARTHKVVAFPYDWRLSPAAEADRLAARVRAELTEAGRGGQPVRFLAHSMGGLVARTMIARHEALWRDVCAHPGARLVMLGTPNGGSHSITELLVGQSATLRKLARLDARHGVAGLLQILSRFPGILAMLPHDPHEDYFAPATWQAYRTGADGWSLPSAADLEQARELRRVLETSPVDPARMLYVAGSADVTLAEMRLVRDTRRNRDEIQFLATTRGDGRVTWDSGIPPALAGRTWFMDVEHGNLAAHPPAFDALEELLEKGTTTLLPQAPPVSRTATTLFPKPPEEDDRYPDEEDLAADVLGASPRKRRLRTAPEHRLSVDVVHGNLAFARYPVAVGHYAGDTIVSAERHLDLALGGALSRRNQLRLYPAAIETSAVFINPRLKDDPQTLPQGAIVVGLGTVGHLSAAALARSFTRALLEYALESGKLPAKAEAGGPSELGVSALLIGTGAGGISVSDSVFALLRGVLRANEVLATADQPARIASLELVELWEDNAIQALRALRRLEQEPELRGKFVLKSEVGTGEGGLRRLVYEEPSGWWHRLQILGKEAPGEGGDGALRFAAVTRRARSEVRHLGTQRALVDQFVSDAVRTTRADRDVSRTLFELLLPNELKESAPDEDSLVLLVDEESAHYPWELLEDPRGDGGRPWAVDRGLLRQLESLEFRETVLGTLDDNALVVGDPVSSFSELPGAQAEADAVWRALQQRFAAVKSIRESSRQVVTRLFARPYKVLHLAGHGVYNWSPGESITTVGEPAPARRAVRYTGMVLGDGVFLTPKEVEQMRQVPELVFINCCFLGRVESAPAPGGPDREFHRLAANVATQFIRIGVRAVIAAGWAVDDDAATTFATTFYGEMLKGRPLGEAVRIARRTTFDRHPGSNTWGAYQCYGDPDYRLVILADAADTAGTGPIPLSHSQAVQDLKNITARLKTGSATGVEPELRRIDAINELAGQRGWTRRGAVLAALGEAYGEANQFDRATEHYLKAMDAEDGQITVKIIEQWVNLTSRYAVERWRGGTGVSAECVADVKKVIAKHTALMAQLGWTPERRSIQGSAYKRLAWLASTEPERLKALKEMSKAYSKAFDKTFDPYPVLNWLTAALVLGWQGQAPRGLDFADYLHRARVELQRQLEERRTFWPDVGLVDAELIETLATGKLEKASVDALADKYNRRRAYASDREFASVLDQLDFLIAMAPAGQGDLARELASLRELVSRK